MSSAHNTFNALSYNVRSLRDGRVATATVIRACQPDVACIQEAPRFLRWRSRCARLARTSGLLYVCGGRDAAGVMVLAAPGVRVLSKHVALLTKRPGLHQRGIAAAVLEKDGRRFGVASVHLGLDENERRVHAEEIFSTLAAIDAERSDRRDRPVPWVIGGDFNEAPGGPARGLLEDGRADAWVVATRQLGELTSPAKGPFQRIDGLFVDARFSVLEAGVPHGLPHPEQASDHLPVLAVLAQPE